MIDKTLYVQKVASASQLELLTITYELTSAYIDDARTSKNEQSIVDARRCVNLLMKSLNMKYDIAQTLYSIYIYVDRKLAQALFSKTGKQALLDECSEILNPLMESYKSIRDGDSNESVMQNAQQVYAGLTYSGAGLEEYIPDDSKRGFKA